jgi:uncharacterized membrane protein YbhN (UPF0104 family)
MSALPPDRRKRRILILQLVISLVIVVGIFAVILPKIASYASVWRTIGSLSWAEVLTLLGATVLNLFMYWFQMMAAMPGLTLWQAAVNNQSSTTIADILPGGGWIAVGMAYTMFRSWGFTGSEIALVLTTTGIWNSFLKLALPVVALGLLAVTGRATRALLIPSLVGVVVLAGCLVLLAMALAREEFARAAGGGLGRAWSWALSLFNKPPIEWGDSAGRLRAQTIKLLARRWPALTVTTVVSHLALWFVLYLSLRHVGVSGHEITAIQVLAVFAFGRLLSAAPITPGGVGVVELALIGGLYAAGHTHADVSLDVFKAQVTAAVLMFRALTYGLQIPLGGFTYLIWQRKKSWRRAPPDEPVTERVGTVAT